MQHRASAPAFSAQAAGRVLIHAVVLAGVAVVWRDTLAAAARSAQATLAPAWPWIAAGAQLSGNALEALFYARWWRGRGLALPFGGTWATIAALSALEASSLRVTTWARAQAAPPAWAALLAGPRAQGGAGDGLSVAFGAAGALAAARIGATAWVQRRAGAPWAAALALTLGAWLALRCAAWWALDLARGGSPLPT